MTDPTRTPLTAESEAFHTSRHSTCLTPRGQCWLHIILVAIEAAAATAERERIAGELPDAEKHEPPDATDPLVFAAIARGAAAAERERIAAALPMALSEALSEARKESLEGVPLATSELLRLYLDDATWLRRSTELLAHSAVRAIFAPEDE